jgi:hypothetical protein
MKDENLWEDTHGVDDLADVTPSWRAARSKVKASAAPKGAAGADRFIGCPKWWWDAVYPISRGKAELAVAIFLWRQRVIQRGSSTIATTIAVTNVSLSGEMGLDRRAKYRAITLFEAAGFITVVRCNKKALRVTFRPRRAIEKAARSVAHVDM